MISFYTTLIDGELHKNRFEQIYESYCQLMMFQAVKILKDHYLAEDAVHDAFIRIVCNIDTVERLNEYQVKRYALIAARNSAIDLYRRHYKQMHCEVPYEDPELNAQVRAGTGGMENSVLEAVKQMPGIYREVFLMKYSLGLSNEEIGSLLKLSVSGVKQRLTRGKAILKESLKEEYDEAR